MIITFAKCLCVCAALFFLSLLLRLKYCYMCGAAAKCFLLSFFLEFYFYLFLLCRWSVHWFCCFVYAALLLAIFFSIWFLLLLVHQIVPRTVLNFFSYFVCYTRLTESEPLTQIHLQMNTRLMPKIIYRFYIHMYIYICHVSLSRTLSHQTHSIAQAVSHSHSQPVSQQPTVHI